MPAPYEGITPTYPIDQVPTLGTGGHSFDPNATYTPEQQQQILQFVKLYTSGDIAPAVGSFVDTPWGPMLPAYIGQRIQAELANPDLAFTQEFDQIKQDFEEAYEGGIAEEQGRYDTNIGEMQAAQTALGLDTGNVTSRYDTAGATAKTATDAVTQGYKDAASDANTAYGGVTSGYDAAQAALNTAYTDPTSGVQAGYGNRAADLGGQVSGVQGDLASSMGGISSRYSTREADLLGQLEGYGDIQRGDLERAYDARSAEAGAHLENTGLGNSTIMSSVQSGVQTDRELDRARMEDQLRREQLGYQSQWSQDVLGAQEREAAANAQAGFTGVGMNAQFGADALGAQERGATLGYDAALASQQAAERGLQFGYNADAASQQAAERGLQFGYGAASDAAQAAAQGAQSRYASAQDISGIRERRDVPNFPSLLDRANLNIQGGLNPASRVALPSGVTLTGVGS